MPESHTTDEFPKHLWARARPVVAALVTGLFAAGVVAQTPQSQGQAELMLADVLREIAARSTASITAGLDLGAAQEATRHTQASYRPSVSLSGGYDVRDHALIAKFGALQAPETESNFFVGQVDATQLLWDGGRRSWAVKSSQGFELATAMRGQADVRTAQLDGLGAYMNILILKAQRRVVAQRATSLQDHLRVAKDLFDHGVVGRNDLLETEVRLRLVQDQAFQVENGEAVAVQALNRLMGRTPADPLVLPEALPSPPPLPATADELKKHAEEGNQQLLALRARVQAEEAAVAMRKAESYPTVIAQASSSYQENRYLVYPNANVLFLGVSWQAYDGGVREANVREAELAVSRTQQLITDLQRQLEIQVEQAHRDYTQALREAATAETNVKASDENLRIQEDQYKSGLARTTDVLDAESVLADSRFALATQRYNAYLKQGVLLTAAGEDLPAFFANLTPNGQEK